MIKAIVPTLRDLPSGKAVCMCVCVCVCMVCVHTYSVLPILCDPIDCSPPGSSVNGISQARILEWVAMSYSRGSSPTQESNLCPCIDRQILYHCATREGHRGGRWTLRNSS